MFLISKLNYCDDSYSRIDAVRRHQRGGCPALNAIRAQATDAPQDETPPATNVAEGMRGAVDVRLHRVCPHLASGCALGSPRKSPILRCQLYNDLIGQKWEEHGKEGRMYIWSTLLLIMF